MLMSLNLALTARACLHLRGRDAYRTSGHSARGRLTSPLLMSEGRYSRRSRVEVLTAGASCRQVNALASLISSSGVAVPGRFAGLILSALPHYALQRLQKFIATQELDDWWKDMIYSPIGLCMCWLRRRTSLDGRRAEVKYARGYALTSSRAKACATLHIS